MASFAWQCTKCGKTISKATNTPTPPPTPTMSGKCPATPTGKHIVVRIK